MDYCHSPPRSFLLALTLLSVLGLMPLSTQAQSITVTVPEVEISAGETVTLSIEADLGGEQVDSYSNMEFTFDSSVINIVDVRDGTGLSFGTSNFVENQEGDTLTVSNIADSAPVSGSGEFLRIDVTLTQQASGQAGTPFRLTPSENPIGTSTSVFGADGGGNLTIDSIEQGSVGDLDMQSARQQGSGNTATVTGTVTRAFGAYVRFQDDSGPTGASGLTIGETSGDFQQDIGSGIIQGTRLYVRGTLSDPDGLLRVSGQNLEEYTILEQAAPPAAQEVSLNEIQGDGEDYESELLRILGISFPSASGTFSSNTTYEVQDVSASFDYRVKGSNETGVIGESIPGGTFTYEGVLGQSMSSGSGAGYQLVPIRPSKALPVEMVGLSAARTGSSVELRWRTASETNNAGFRVEHSPAGRESWRERGFVKSKAAGGTTTEGHSYRSVIEEDLGPGTHRFRLKQMDLDGTTSLTDPVTLELKMKQALSLSPPAPNPTSGKATVTFGVKEATEVEVVMYNVLGQEVRTLYKGTPPAEQATILTVETEDLPSGRYLMQLRADGQTQTRRLMVVR